MRVHLTTTQAAGRDRCCSGQVEGTGISSPSLECAGLDIGLGGLLIFYGGLRSEGVAKGLETGGGY